MENKFDIYDHKIQQDFFNAYLNYSIVFLLQEKMM